MSSNLMNGAQIVLECLLREKVDMFFGYPGGVTLPLYDALYDHRIKHILVRHEAGGGHAAEGYAKATGKVGVAFATSGPGATNLVTAIADAVMDSVPTVFITGQPILVVKATHHGAHAFTNGAMVFLFNMIHVDLQCVRM